MKFKIGDIVAVTDDAIKGKVTAIDSEMISILTEDDFIMRFTEKELIKIGVEQSELAKSVIVSSQLSYKEDYKKGQKQTRVKKNKGEIPPMEVDLHIDKLTKPYRGMDNYDMLTLQIDTAKHKLEFAIRNRIPRIVFIHGVGAGVLKTELNYLFNRYNVSTNDASYQKYGMGATEVYILQNTRE